MLKSFDCHCHKVHRLLMQQASGLTFWYQPTQVVLETGH